MTIEVLLIALVSAVALIPIVRWLLRSASTSAAIAVCLAWGLGIGLVLTVDSPKAMLERDVTTRPAEIPGAEYVGSDTCRACHPDQYASWHASYHRSMTQVPSEESIAAPWHDVVLRFQHNYRLEQRGDEFWAHSDNPSWTQGNRFPPGQRPIVLVTGSHHEQFYWRATNDDREMELLPLVYRIAEKRWLPHQGVLLSPPAALAAHGDRRWNMMCIACHATNGRPQIELIDDSVLGKMETEASEFGISCEACHGPAAEHVRSNRSPTTRYARHLSSAEDGDPTIVNPAKLSSKRSTEVCGSCHSVFLFGRDALRSFIDDGHGFQPGDTLADSRWVVRYEDRHDPRIAEIGGEGEDGFQHRFWADGMPSTNGREMTGLLESKCYQQSEMTCLSCHQMHKPDSDPRSLEQWADDQLAADMNGDEACLQCHEKYRENVTEHTHHPAESAGSRCTNCHMPNTAYGLLKQTRSHLIDSPSARNTLETTRPNACNLCHLDKTLAWGAGRLEDWYDIPQPVIQDPDLHVTSDAMVRALSGDAGLRAMVAWHMGWQPAVEASGTDWMIPVLAQLLEDPYMAVRFIAGRSLRSLPDWQDFDYMYLEEPAKLAAANARARERWNRLYPEAERREVEEVLIGPDAQRFEMRFRRLLNERDDRIIYRQE